jgi:Holliday junction resolvase RusA-like endonuclease
MTEPITIVLAGAPTPKGRARLGANNNIYTPSSTRRYQTDLAWQAKLAMKAAGRGVITSAVSVDITFEIFGSPTSKKSGDVDNLAKSALDGLRGIVFIDDCQVVLLTAQKLCSTNPKTMITVTERVPRPWED